ncbi:MAG: hypothetical protein NZ481_09075 [Candidatus Kapabacteria bacterium]|nr:hypothetical protein [Candidatus Kapabacteria bacterium]
MMRALVLAVVTGGLMLPTSVFAQQLWWLVEQTRVISNSTAWDVNDAGVAVGMIAYPNPTNLATEIRRAVRWSAATGLQILDSIAQSPSDEARAISANGQVIAGIIATPNGERGALWTESGPEVLHAIKPNGYQAGAVALSARGDIPVGYSSADNTGIFHAVRWVGNDAARVLPATGFAGSVAHGVSGDGTTIVGNATTLDNTRSIAFRWYASTYDTLGTLGGSLSEARAASADGSVIVGWSANVANVERAFRWTASRGMHDIQTIGAYGRAYDVSADGKTVVGQVTFDNNQTSAFVWTEQDGMKLIELLYPSVVADGSRLMHAYAVSPNGRYVVGRGYNAALGRMLGWILDTRAASSTFEERLSDPGYKLETSSSHLLMRLPEHGEVTLVLYDLCGRSMGTLVNGYHSAGNYSVLVPSNFSAGVYIAVMRTRSVTLARPVVVGW